MFVPWMIVDVEYTRKSLPDWWLLAKRLSSKRSKPKTTLCEPMLPVEAKYVALAVTFWLSRRSLSQTPQKVGEL